MLFVQFGINSTRDVWKFCQIGLAPAARTIEEKFPNITRTINPKLYSQSHDYLYKFIYIYVTYIFHIYFLMSYLPFMKKVVNSLTKFFGFLGICCKYGMCIYAIISSSTARFYAKSYRMK